MASDRRSPGAPDSLIPAIMDLQIREECVVEDGVRDEDNLDESIQRDGIPGRVILEETLPDSIAPEGVTRVTSHAVPEDMIDMGASTERYQYACLSQPDEIRCLVLESGTGDADDPLVGSLHHHSLDDKPDFEAISYTWGSPHMTHTILCDGRQMAITKNLHTCLLQTRLADRKRTLWADSICINQDDLKEKGHQVGIMSRIYSEARRVLICLGPDENGHAEDAAGLVSEVSQWIQKTVDLTDGKPNSFPYINQNEWPISDQRWLTLSSMSGLSWFERGWVVQEAGLAKHAQLLWGDVEMGWIVLLRVFLWAAARAPAMLTIMGLRWPANLHWAAYLAKHPAEILVLGAPKPFTLLEILNWGTTLQFGDDRDRIYAFLGLPEAADARHGLQVNYELSYFQVYFEFASWYISTAGSTALLDFVHHDDDTLLADFPSWMPQWHVRRSPVIPMSSPADAPILPVSGGPDYAALPAVRGTVLAVRGFLIDSIAWTSQVLEDDISIEDMAELWAWFEEHSKDSAYRAFPSVLAFLEAIQLGKRWSGLKPQMSFANDAKYALRLQKGKPLPSHPSLEPRKHASNLYHGDTTTTHNGVQMSMSHRRLCITSRGYYGVLPAVAREGDLCCIVFGTKSPCIIRQSGSERHYKFLGEAFFASARLNERALCPYRVGSGPSGYADWLEWNLKEQEILFC